MQIRDKPISEDNHSSLQGVVESILPGGEALVRADAGLYLVANVLPGDLISFQPLRKRRGALRGVLAEVLTPSPMRVEPACSVADKCGGCALAMLHPVNQLQIKSAWVTNAFRQSMSEQTLWIPASEQLLQRRRLRWYVGHDEQGAFLGFRARNSHRVVRHDRCICLSDKLNLLRERLERSAEMFNLENYQSVQAVELDDGIHLILEGESLPQPFEAACHEIENSPIQWWYRDAQKTVPLIKPLQTFHDLIIAREVLINEQDLVAIQIGPDDFIQGQEEGNRIMIKQILNWSAGAKFVVDLFSGVGNFSLPLAKIIGSRVVGAELNPASVRAANANAKRLAVKAEYVQANLFESFAVEPFAGADVLILDPPRRGAKKVCEMMGRLLPAKIIMVSCDVASGGRDAAVLTSLGYRLHTLRAVDLFPYTGHVEAMSLWRR